MLLGSQWYILFNVLAGASAMPHDLREVAEISGLGRWARWRTLYLPAIVPYLITGLLTAAGGAWNASIVAEYVRYRGETLIAPGLGSLITTATAAGNFPLLAAGCADDVARYRRDQPHRLAPPRSLCGRAIQFEQVNHGLRGSKDGLRGYCFS
jgi:hypothetical protein